MSILIIDSNSQEAQVLREALRQHGWRAESESDPGRGLDRCRSGEFDLTLADTRLSETGGIDFVRRLRSDHNAVPLIMLGEANRDDLSCEILRAGADDYVARPASIAVLTARIEALLRRVHGFLHQKGQETRLAYGDIQMDLIQRTATRNNKNLLLKPREFKLLEFLVRNADHVVTREELLRHVWGIVFDPHTNVVEVHVSRLRAKLDRPFALPLLRTVRSQGYMLSRDYVETGTEAGGRHYCQ